MISFSPDHLSAADGIRLIVDQFAADPTAVVRPIVGWVLVPAAIIASALWAVLTLVGRHPDAALPPERPEPDPEVEETADLSPAAQILAGRVPLDKTVEIRAARR